MWILTPKSFVSIVAHRSKPDTLLVRARLPGDLRRLFPGCKVSRTPSADYRFRTELPRRRVMNAVAEEISAIAYDNVKGAIPTKPVVHSIRHRMMSRMWQAGMDAQQDAHRRALPAWGDPGSDLSGL
jgi:hypothetical protein